MKSFKKSLALMLALIIMLLSVPAFAVQSSAAPAALHTEGEKIIDSNGKEIILRGTN